MLLNPSFCRGSADPPRFDSREHRPIPLMVHQSADAFFIPLEITRFR
jgi:hypothetical protein